MTCLRLATLLLGIALVGPFALAAQEAKEAPVGQATDGSQRDGYRYFEIGDVHAARPGKTQAGLLMVGGGDWPYDGFRWFIDKAGHGRIVILRASGTTESQDEFFNQIGGITGAQTIVFEDRKAASDPTVLAIVRNADGLFLAGGDQSNYVRMWKGTPLNEAINAHVRAGKPLGGTSAGLAVQGAWSYGAMDGGSLVSHEAMENPLGPAVTLVGNFLQLPYLQHVITDSHFDARERQGRLITWLARLAQEQPDPQRVGLGIDEYTALCVDNTGMGRVVSGNGGHVWLFRAPAHVQPLKRGQPLTAQDVRVTGLGTQSRLQLDTLQVQQPAFERRYDINAGKLSQQATATVPAP